MSSTLICAVGFIAGVVMASVAFFFALAMCNAAAGQDPESDEYAELVKEGK